MTPPPQMCSSNLYFSESYFYIMHYCRGEGGGGNFYRSSVTADNDRALVNNRHTADTQTDRQTGLLCNKRQIKKHTIDKALVNNRHTTDK